MTEGPRPATRTWAGTCRRRHSAMITLFAAINCFVCDVSVENIMIIIIMVRTMKQQLFLSNSDKTQNNQHHIFLSSFEPINYALLPVYNSKHKTFWNKKWASKNYVYFTLRRTETKGHEKQAYLLYISAFFVACKLSYLAFAWRNKN